MHFGGVLTLTVPVKVAHAGNRTEFILAYYGNYTGSFDSISVSVDDAGACEKLTAEPHYGATQFSVLLDTDRSGCRKKGISPLLIAAIVVAVLLLLGVITVIVLLVFVFPNMVKRKPRLRTRVENLLSTPY